MTRRSRPAICSTRRTFASVRERAIRSSLPSNGRDKDGFRCGDCRLRWQPILRHGRRRASTAEPAAYYEGIRTRMSSVSLQNASMRMIVVAER